MGIFLGSSCTGLSSGSLVIETPADLLGPDGPLAECIQGFAPREQQQRMADAVGRAIEGFGTLVVEAGTGTGKTFAYLVPVLLSGRKVIISTGTRNLQDQLFHKDLPLVAEALGRPVQTALLKGRSNYLCLYRLEEVGRTGGLPGRQEVAHLARIRAWASVTHAGDLAEIPDIPEDSGIWSLVTSTTDNCLGADCPLLEDCHVYRARREAQAADLVVVNHHLLCADLGLKEDGFGDILPAADAYVVDEAHQLPEVASGFFGVSLGSRRFAELARDATEEQIKEGGEYPDIPAAADALQKAALDLRLAMGGEGQRAPWSRIAGRDDVQTGIVHLKETLDVLADALEPAAKEGKGLENCHRRAMALADDLALAVSAKPEGYVQWFETYKRSFVVHLTPLDVAEAFQEKLPARPCAWIYTSATLAVREGEGSGFGHFNRQLGLDCPREDGTAFEELLLDSPFDFKRNAVFYVPKGLPDPRDEAYVSALTEAAVPLLQAGEGRAFMLFTSYRALDRAAEFLEQATDLTLLTQGSAPRAQLLEKFRTTSGAVLLGTGSFWEGVDVRGPALSLVIIDKLPFASPGDPVLQARIEALRNAGSDPFHDYQLPRAVIALKQGVGRLIRDVDDRGVLMICDPRLLGRGYGRVFLDSLPDMARTRVEEKVTGFLERRLRDARQKTL